MKDRSLHLFSSALFWALKLSHGNFFLFRHWPKKLFKCPCCYKILNNQPLFQGILVSNLVVFYKCYIHGSNRSLAWFTVALHQGHWFSSNVIQVQPNVWVWEGQQHNKWPPASCTCATKQQLHFFPVLLLQRIKSLDLISLGFSPLCVVSCLTETCPGCPSINETDTLGCFQAA